MPGTQQAKIRDVVSTLHRTSARVVLKRPPHIAPYQPRLDWQMWLAPMSSAEQYSWTLNLVWKLLHNDPGAVGFFAANPFADKPPRYIRAWSTT